MVNVHALVMCENKPYWLSMEGGKSLKFYYKINLCFEDEWKSYLWNNYDIYFLFLVELTL